MNSVVSPVRKLLVIGLGLIGGSLAKAARLSDSNYRVTGYDRDPDAMRQAVSLGVVDRVDPDLGHAVEDADIIFLAIPLLANRALLAQIQPYIKDTTVITDGGSAKGSVVTDARQVLTEVQMANFVPGHPIAGAERSGVTATDETLYHHHRVIITPSVITSQSAIEAVIQLWQSVGADVDRMSVEHHDDVLAATSHLPHLLAFNLVDTLAKNSENREIFHYAAGGFRDFTRIAASDPVMWHDIFMANRESVLKVMDQYLTELHQLRNAVAHADGDYMKEVFRHAKDARDHFSQILEERQQTYKDNNK